MGGQDRAAAVTAKLRSRLQPHLSKLLLGRGFLSFSPVLPASVLLSFEKDEIGGVGVKAAKRPKLGCKQERRGKDCGERAVPGCFPSFRNHPIHRGSPPLQVPRATTEDAEGLSPSFLSRAFPTPILQDWIIRVKTTRKCPQLIRIPGTDLDLRPDPIFAAGEWGYSGGGQGWGEDTTSVNFYCYFIFPLLRKHTQTACCNCPCDTKSIKKLGVGEFGRRTGG